MLSDNLQGNLFPRKRSMRELKDVVSAYSINFSLLIIVEPISRCPKDIGNASGFDV